MPRRVWHDGGMTIPGGATSEPGPAGPTGIVVRDALPWEQCVQIVQTAEDTGYEAVFVPEIAGREAFVSLSGYGHATSLLRLGTGVVTMWSRSPAITAMAASSVHDLSAGRLILGIGSGAPVRPSDQELLREHGSIGLVRGYVGAVREAFSENGIRTDGPFAGTGFRSELRSPHGSPPVWIAALGDRMITLGGEVADGILLNWCTPVRVAQAKTLIAESASRAGRGAEAVTIGVYVRACLGLEDDVASAALRDMTGRYASAPHYRAQMRAMGLGAEADVAAAAFEAGRIADVPDELVRRLTVRGGRAAAMKRFAEYRDAGADLILCYPVAALDAFSSVLGTVLAAAPSPAVER
jgi:5,10-methylenetetrahydromethanopterin reductase